MFFDDVAVSLSLKRIKEVSGELVVGRSTMEVDPALLAKIT
jgi:hypothetical protein